MQFIQYRNLLQHQLHLKKNNMNTQTQIPCPICKTPIPFNIDSLIKGEKFICSHCGAAIGLSSNSREQVSDAMKKLEEMRK